MYVLIAFVLSIPQSTSVKDVGWLAGCWEFRRGTRHVTEQWMAPAGGTMLGLSRTVSGDKTTEYEFIVIREAAGKLEYVAKPSRQPEAIFTSVRVTAEEAIFENPQHDFPTRIHYRRQPAGGVLATIEGTINGSRRAIEYPYAAAVCGR
jgi:hypothetical protein